MKRFSLFFLLITVVFFTFKTFPPTVARAEESSEEVNLESEINDLIDSLDLTEFESYLTELPDEIKGNGSIKDQLLKMLKGQTDADFTSLSEYLLNTFFINIKQKIPTFITLFALLLISAIVSSIKPERIGNSVYEIVHFACFSIIVCIVVTVAYSLIAEAKDAIEKVGRVVQSVFPIMLALMTVTGNTSAVAVYNPSMLFITDFVVILINKVVFPVILGMLAIGVISNVCKSIKLNGLFQFSSSSLKWIIGLIATVFSLFLTVRGLTSGIHDGISIRALKYTVNSSVPLVGGILRDGLDLILASGLLVKNALGGLSILVIFGTALKPIMEIACVSLSLKLVNAVLEPLSDFRVTSFINSVGSVINFAIASVIIVTLMYVIIIILAICSSQMMF